MSSAWAAQENVEPICLSLEIPALADQQLACLTRQSGQGLPKLLLPENQSHLWLDKDFSHLSFTYWRETFPFLH